jgi:Dual specificity phosphatase, catalytic domain
MPAVGGRLRHLHRQRGAKGRGAVNRSSQHARGAVNPSTPQQRGRFGPAAGCLALAGGVFILVYSFCNRFTDGRPDVGSFYFEWERGIPFVPALVVPYWSLDLFFCGAFFLCRTKAELRTLTMRVILVVLASGACFLLIPLRFGWARPEPQGWTAFLFRALYANDLPYNLAPSLHISLRSIVWIVYGAHLRGRLRTAVKVWFIMIGLSTLFVWQHHLIDVATGFFMAWAIQAVVPAEARRREPVTRGHRKLALSYGACAAGGAAVATLGGGWLWMSWPAVATGIMSVAYALGDARLTGKENGTISPAAEWCLLPWLLSARLVQHRWLRCHPATREVAPGVLIGRRHTAKEAAALVASGPLAVLDLTAESNAPPAFRERALYHNIPLLDLVSPPADALRHALDFIAAHQPHRTVLVHCQLGLLRSAGVAAAWLVSCGIAASHADAAEMLLRIDSRIRHPEIAAAS